MKKKVIVGSRESKLAVIQSKLVMEKIAAAYPDIQLELVTMKTTGDIILDRTLDKVGGKGLFVKELDRALREGTIDISVHSLKDIPSEVPEDLPLLAFSAREASEDVLVLPKGISSQEEMDRSKPIGSSSPRRNMQLAKLYPGFAQKSVRGNVLTRLEKLDRGEYCALILAKAGLVRLGLEDRISKEFAPWEMVPAAGQGIMVVQGRRGEDYGFLDCIDDERARVEATAERTFVARLEGGCSSPIGAFATLTDDRILVKGFYADEDQTGFLVDEIQGPVQEANGLAIDLADRMKENFGKGKVWLVGAGPGDAGLFTLKGARVLRHADVVVYDSLVGPAVLAMIPSSAEGIDVGKKAGHHPVPQERINEILLEKALEGKQVVRLKGGDPFLFGRGGEELELLVEKGIAFEIIPGVTSAIAVPAYNGIPVTHRDHTSSVHIITGHTKKDNKDATDYGALVRLDGTLVFLMGVSAMERICSGLLAAGMDPAMPAAVLEKGTTAKQRRVVATLDTLVEEAKKARIGTPAIIVVGKVCALEKDFHWAEDRPLGGMKIAVTRPRGRGTRLGDRLAMLGAEVIPLPAIETSALPLNSEIASALDRIEEFAWVVFTSVAGVEAFFDLMRQKEMDIRSLQGIRFAAIGTATSREIEQRGIRVDLMPKVYSGRDLGTELAKAVAPGEKILIPRSAIGTRQVLDPLDEAGFIYEDLPVYDTVMEGSGPARYDASIDLVTFTSASTVEGFARANPGLDYATVKALCIGEQTADAARSLGMDPTISEISTIESMVDKVMEIKCT